MLIHRCEDHENFIDLNGESSGIVISNMNQSFKGSASFFITFRTENFVSADKRTLLSNHNILKDRIDRDSVSSKGEDRVGSFVATMEREVNINANYFACSTTEQPADEITDRSSMIENNELYYPRLFSISSSQATLELYIGIQDRQKCLILEVSFTKTTHSIASREKSRKEVLIESVLTFSRKKRHGIPSCSPILPSIR